MRKLLVSIVLAALAPAVMHAQAYQEQYRPGFHFSPKEKWMNDPNGLVRYDGVYHLFFQFYPNDNVWGPMHWGHATSKDLVHWQQQPVALYPDSLGYIFSGSAVVDSTNTSGFGQPGRTPLVAVFTHHDPEGEKRHASDFQNQSLAYSLDKGATWMKYYGNPVLKNPGITDFRDPNVSWYARGKKWIMTLATNDHITFYSSSDLKSWAKESEFGQGLGEHGGVWECPDLFSFTRKEGDHERTYWVLLISNNPGAPNGGSGTQYFIGDWDGHTFKPLDKSTRWIDYGPDDYAGVLWNNAGRRRIFLGWMTNWDYATKVPTSTWRGAMTVPRNVFLLDASGKPYLASKPAPELMALAKRRLAIRRMRVDSSADLTKTLKDDAGRYDIEVKGEADQSVAFVFGNTAGEQVVFGYNNVKQEYYLDRSGAGRQDFHPGFGGIYSAPRISKEKELNIEFVVDRSSIEIFADGGLTVMTGLFFSQQPMTRVKVNVMDRWTIKELKYAALASIW
jgi:fructan beta-fructosidase